MNCDMKCAHDQVLLHNVQPCPIRTAVGGAEYLLQPKLIRHDEDPEVS